jgi:hypothetical protein
MMLNLIKSLLKVKLNDHNLLLGVMTKMQVFKCPGQTVLDSSGLDEPILILMDQGSDMLLEPISQNLGDEFNRRIEREIGLKSVTKHALSTLGIRVI